MIKRITAFLISFCLIFEQTGFAQVAVPMGIPAYLCSFTPVADKFRPVHLRSIDLNSVKGNFELILDKGDLKDVKPRQLEETTREIYQYFRVGLALPNNYFWVNLRPDSPDEMIEPLLEKTDVGRILLAADLQLKKDLANATSSQTPEGKLYWDRLYAKASELYQQQDIQIPTLTRPWIVPGEIIIRSSEKGAFVYKATLKVMLEQDYIKDSPVYNFADPRQKDLNNYSSQLIRELIIPKLTREVNSSKRYAQLRQVYYSLILAQWFKSKSKINKIDSLDLSGLTSQASWSKDTYYQAYCKSFRKGEYNRQEQVSSASGLSLRQYFSGGIVMMSKPVGEWIVIPSGVTEFFAANQQYFARLTVDSRGDVAQLAESSVLADGGQKSDIPAAEKIKPATVSDLKKTALLHDIFQKVKDHEQYLFPAMGVGAAVFVYSISPSLLLWLIPVGVVAVALIGAELASLEYRNIKKTDPDLLLIARGNPLSLTSGVQLLALGLDGILDMREVRRSPSKFFVNLNRVMYALPTGFIWTAMELAIDYFNGLRPGEDILKPKLDMMRFALRHSSGINPLKVMYLLFTQWCFAKNDLERRFMLYETTLLHARSSGDLAAAREDTFQNNTFLASEAAFYHLLKQLKLEEFDETLEKIKSGGSLLYKQSQIKKDNIRFDDLINLYLAERNRLWQVRQDRGLTEQDKALMAFLGKPGYLAAAEHQKMPYYAFVVLKLLDRHFNDYFSANDLLGVPKYDKLLEMDRLTNEQVIKGLVESGIVIENGEEYFLSVNFKQNFQQFIDSYYREITEAELLKVPEYEGALHVNNKLYRWAQNAAYPQRDGGEIPVIAPAVVDMQAIEKEADRSVLEEEALEAAAGFGIDIEPELLTGPELIEWSARKQAIRQQVYATAGAAARFIPTDATTNELLFFLEEFSNGLLVSSQEEKPAGVLSRRFQAAAALICLALPVLLSGGFVSALADVAPTGGLNVSPVAVFDHLNHQDQSLLVVVNSSVEQYIDEDLEQYTRDLNNEGYKVTIVNSRGIETPEELRRLLQDEHAQGNADMVFFVGKLPVAQYLAPDQKDRVFDIQRINKLISLRDQLNTLTPGKDLSGLAIYSEYQDRIKEWPGYKEVLIKQGGNQKLIDEVEQSLPGERVWVDQHQELFGEVYERYLEYDDLLFEETVNRNVPAYLEENNLTSESLYPDMFDETHRITHDGLVKEFSYAQFNPVDFYFTDLNGRFVNYNNRTGFFRNYTPADSVIELGLGRIDASGFSQGDLAREIKLYKDYFRRNHAYRLEYYGSPKRGLFFVNKDWADLAESSYRYSDIGRVYRDTTAISDPSEVNAENYLDQIQSNKYAWVTLYSHSDPGRHTFNYDNSEVKSPMIRNASAYFYWLYACSAVRYTEEEFIGGQYLFGDNNQGLAVIGSTYPSAFHAGAGFFSPLAEGNSLGQAYMQWVETENILTEPINIKNDFGVAIIGDPTLVPYSRTEAQYDKLEKLLNDPREVFLWSLIPTNGILLAYLAKRIATDLTKEKKEEEDSKMPGQPQRDGGNPEGLTGRKRVSLLEVYEARKNALSDEYKRKLGWVLEIGLEQEEDPAFETAPTEFLAKWQKAMQDLAALEDGLRRAYQYKSRGDLYSSKKLEDEDLRPVQEAKSPLLRSILTRLPGVSLAVLLLFGFGIISGGIAHVTASPLYEQFAGPVQVQSYVLGINRDAVYPLSFNGSDEIFSPLGLQTSLEDPGNAKGLLENKEQGQDSGSYKLVTEVFTELELSDAEFHKIFSGQTLRSYVISRREPFVDIPIEKQAAKELSPLQVNQSSFDTFQRIVEVKAQLDNARAEYEKKYDGRTFEQDYEYARTALNISEEQWEESAVSLNGIENNPDIFSRGEGKDISRIWALQKELNSLGYENLFLVPAQDGKLLQKEEVERIYKDYTDYKDYVIGQYQDPALVRILLWIYFIDPELANGIKDKEVKFVFTDDFIVLFPVPGFSPAGQAVPPLVAGPDGEIRLLPRFQEIAAKDPIIKTAAHEIFHNIQQQGGIPQLLSYIANPLPEENQARIRGEEDEHILNILPLEMRVYYTGRMDDLDPEHVVFLHKRIQDIDRQEIRDRIPPDLDPETKLDYLLTVWGPPAIFISSVGLGLSGLKMGLRQRSPEELMSGIKEIAKKMESPETPEPVQKQVYLADGGEGRQDGGDREKESSIRSQAMMNKLWSGFMNSRKKDLQGRPVPSDLSSKDLEDFKDYLKDRYYFSGTGKFRTGEVQALASDLGIDVIFVRGILNMLVWPSAERKKILHMIYSFKASPVEPYLTFAKIGQELYRQGISAVVYIAVDFHVLAYLGLIKFDPRSGPGKELKIISVDQERFKSIYQEIAAFGNSEAQRPKSIEEVTKEIFLKKARESGISADSRKEIYEILFGDNRINTRDVADEMKKTSVSPKGVLEAKKKILGLNRQEMEQFLESGLAQENGGETGGAELDGGAKSKLDQTKNPPAALTFLIADIKNTPEGIKILEFGAGVRSGFEGYVALHNKEMMSLFWKQLKTWNIPAWYAFDVLDILNYERDFEEVLALADFEAVAGNSLGTMEDFWKALDKGDFGQKNKLFDPKDITTYSGIIIPNRLLTRREHESLRKHRIIALDLEGAQNFIIRDKFLTKWLSEIIYEDTKGAVDIRGFFPKWMLLPRVYDRGMAARIVDRMPAESYVIKPLDASRGRGVIATSGKELDRVLRIILQTRSELSFKVPNAAAKSLGEDYAFWASDDTPAFIVESRESSTPVTVEDKEFDGTLRMVFSAALNKEKTEVSYLDGYWKLPEQPLGEGDLNRQVISRIHPAENAHPVSAALSSKDKNAVISQLDRALPLLYQKMLSLNLDDVIDRLMRSDDPSYVGYGIYLMGGNERFSKNQLSRLLSLAKKKDALLDDFIGAMIDQLRNKDKINQLILLFKQLISSPSLTAREAVLRKALENYLSEVLESYGGQPEGIISPDLLEEYSSKAAQRDGGSADFVDRLELRGQQVRVYSPAGENTRSKILALAYGFRLNPGVAGESRILVIRPAEVSGYTPEQCREIARKLARASDEAKKKLGIEGKDTLEQILAENFLVIEDNLVVMDRSGQVLIAKIDVLSQVKWLVYNDKAQDDAPLDSLVSEKRMSGSLFLTKKSLKDNLDQLKTSLIAKNYSAAADEKSKDGGKVELGGVDLRQLPVSGQPGAAPALMPQLQKLAQNSRMQDLDREWGQIRAEMLAPEMPYNRIKEYIAVCLTRPDCQGKLDQAVCCIIDILRMEEDQALVTNQELKDILMYLS